MKRDKNESPNNNFIAMIAVVLLIVGIVVTLVVVSPSGDGALEPITPPAEEAPEVPAE